MFLFSCSMNRQSNRIFHPIQLPYEAKFRFSPRIKNLIDDLLSCVFVPNLLSWMLISMSCAHGPPKKHQEVCFIIFVFRQKCKTVLASSWLFLFQWSFCWHQKMCLLQSLDAVSNAWNTRFIIQRSSTEEIRRKDWAQICIDLRPILSLLYWLTYLFIFHAVWPHTGYFPSA